MSDSEVIKSVVRIRSSMWVSNGTIHVAKTITPLKRKSTGPVHLLSEEALMIGADETVERITNLHECPDGIYEVKTCNESKDWETGHIDSYDFYLTPIT